MVYKKYDDWNWEQWDIDYLENSNKIAYVTFTDVDVEDMKNKQSAAVAMQRDGIFDSLGQSIAAIEKAEVKKGHLGLIEGEKILFYVDERGNTPYSDSKVYAMCWSTWIEIELEV